MSVRARFRDRLDEARLVHVDARVIALHLLADEDSVGLTRLLFAGMRAGSVRGQTSVLTLYQVLAEPHRRGESARAAEVARHLSVLPGLELVPVSTAIAAQAAEVRARLGGTAERAVQVATALQADADLFLTQGTTLRRIAGMTVVNLEDYGAPTSPPAPPASAPAAGV